MQSFPFAKSFSIPSKMIHNRLHIGTSSTWRHLTPCNILQCGNCGSVGFQPTLHLELQRKTFKIWVICIWYASSLTASGFYLAERRISRLLLEWKFRKEWRRKSQRLEFSLCFRGDYNYIWSSTLNKELGLMLEREIIIENILKKKIFLSIYPHQWFLSFPILCCMDSLNNQWVISFKIQTGGNLTD